MSLVSNSGCMEGGIIFGRQNDSLASWPNFRLLDLYHIDCAKWKGQGREYTAESVMGREDRELSGRMFGVWHRGIWFNGLHFCVNHLHDILYAQLLLRIRDRFFQGGQYFKSLGVFLLLKFELNILPSCKQLPHHNSTRTYWRYDLRNPALLTRLPMYLNEIVCLLCPPTFCKIHPKVN